MIQQGVTDESFKSLKNKIQKLGLELGLKFKNVHDIGIEEQQRIIGLTITGPAEKTGTSGPIEAVISMHRYGYSRDFDGQRVDVDDIGSDIRDYIFKLQLLEEHNPKAPRALGWLLD